MNSILFVSGGLVFFVCCCVLVLTGWEVVRLRRGESVLSRGQVYLRCIGSALLFILTTQIFFGAAFLKYSRERAVFFLAYWGACALLTGALFCIVVIDWLLVLHRRREAQRELLRRQFTAPAQGDKVTR